MATSDVAQSRLHADDRAAQVELVGGAGSQEVLVVAERDGELTDLVAGGELVEELAIACQIRKPGRC